MTNCTCSPGSPSNGWHEIRGTECRAQDSREWAEAMQAYRDGLLVRLPRSDIGSINLFVKINGRLVAVRQT